MRCLQYTQAKTLAGAKLAEWLAKPTKWLASRNAGHELVMAPKQADLHGRKPLLQAKKLTLGIPLWRIINNTL